jgi:hypothetical protein
MNLGLRFRPARASAGDLAGRGSTWVLNGPLTAALLALCGFQLATWVPHYLTWPWFADHDVFATQALGWQHGQVPYRDLAGNNFPGTIYLFWILGKLFGWGRTVPFWAVDAGFVLIFGASLLGWSGRRFGRLLPGLVGYAVFLSYYLGLEFGRAAQRDWHGPFFLLIGLLAVDAYPGRVSRWLSALTTAIAFAIRPQVVLFVPALLLAISQGASGEAKSSPVRTARTLFGWGVLLILLIVLAFMPLVLAGAWHDFLRSIRITFYGAQYNKTNPNGILNQLLLQALHLEFDLVPLAILVLAPLSEARTRSTARVWLLAYAGAWFYKPLSPVPFLYLEQPLTILWAINIAVLVELLLTPGLASPAIRLVAVLLAATLGVHARPAMCSVAYARQGIEALLLGVDPEAAPLGIHIGLPVDPKLTAFPWEDFRETLAFLRTRTSPDTPVANLLHVVPALNGPTGRTTPLPAESLAWLGVKPDDEGAFARALGKAPAKTLVVWTPEKGKFVDLWSHFDQVKRLAPVIRRDYEPIAHFGDVEIWKRRANEARSVPGTGSQSPPAR